MRLAGHLYAGPLVLDDIDERLGDVVVLVGKVQSEVERKEGRVKDMRRRLGEDYGQLFSRPRAVDALLTVFFIVSVATTQVLSALV